MNWDKVGQETRESQARMHEDARKRDEANRQAKLKQSADDLARKRLHEGASPSSSRGSGGYSSLSSCDSGNYSPPSEFAVIFSFLFISAILSPFVHLWCSVSIKTIETTIAIIFVVLFVLPKLYMAFRKFFDYLVKKLNSFLVIQNVRNQTLRQILCKTIIYSVTLSSLYVTYLMNMGGFYATRELVIVLQADPSFKMQHGTSLYTYNSYVFPNSILVKKISGSKKSAKTQEVTVENATEQMTNEKNEHPYQVSAELEKLHQK
jgi:hypothetical protein